MQPREYKYKVGPNSQPIAEPLPAQVTYSHPEDSQEIPVVSVGADGEGALKVLEKVQLPPLTVGPDYNATRVSQGWDPQATDGWSPMAEKIGMFWDFYDQWIIDNPERAIEDRELDDNALAVMKEFGGVSHTEAMVQTFLTIEEFIVTNIPEEELSEDELAFKRRMIANQRAPISGSTAPKDPEPVPKATGTATPRKTTPTPRKAVKKAATPRKGRSRGNPARG